MKYQLLPSLSDVDFNGLVRSIADNGVLVPIEVDEDGNILDGHHRVAACEKLELADWPKIVRIGLSEDEKRAHVRQINMARRHLSTSQKRQIISAQLIDTPAQSSNSIAAKLGVSDKTVGKIRAELVRRSEIPNVDKFEDTLGRKQPARRPAKYLPQAADVGLYMQGAKDIRTRKMLAKREIRFERDRLICAAGSVVAGQLPRRAFSVLYADVPWKNEVWGDDTGADKNPPYPPMELEDICALCAGEKSPAIDDAVLYFWRKANNVEQALRVIHAWGFEPKSEMIWDKVHIGNGRWVRDRHEVLMICTRGSVPAPVPGENPQSLYREAKCEHSRKPVWFAEQITKIYPDLPKLELFQRKQSLIKGDIRLKRGSGWKFWGFESGGEE